MIGLDTLKQQTHEVVLIESIGEGDPLIARVYRNRRTRSGRDRLRDEIKAVTEGMDKVRAEVAEIEAEAKRLDLSSAIEAKRSQLAQAQLQEASEEAAPALQAELEALETQQEET